MSDPLPHRTVDAVVVGGGAAGLNGAIMLARSRRSVVVVDDGRPRNAPADGDLRFTITLADGRTVTARRVLVATGLRDVLPDVPGLSRHWGQAVVHCPYCHGWEVRDEPIGVLGGSAASVHQAFLFRQLTDDLVFLTRGVTLDADTRVRFGARDIRVVDTPVAEVVTDADGTLAGVRLIDGEVVSRRVLVVGTTMQARTDGLEGLRLPREDLPDGKGRRFVAGTAGATAVPGVWVAGNVTDPTAQVGASAAAGALAGAHINALLAAADTDAALAAHAVAGRA
ncbi:NAD(P)/FAD-dependent oxidoreductase [Ornithinimicrobium sediminis]|uniref:NAD(P)/FAD-dependent oxidoreductase n=1 Tax=Ornithinimicrobium sediminis TaxID=2904603 RepID=UPI001E3D4866|nr:NAD(P)/FAD-dependent oxidoreductase [Ornithinimicrobium sediminis]MCE0488081.1 NAD(P)/FAD-dependent oxidoreductase [Ornithinimicrobium sediminis]